MATLRNASSGKAQPQNERPRRNPTRQRSSASESQSQADASYSSLDESRKHVLDLDDGSEEGRPRKRAWRSSPSITSSSPRLASNPALPTPSFTTTSYSTSSASAEAFSDTDHGEVEDVSSDDVEDELASYDGVGNSDTDDGEVEDEVFSDGGVDNGDADDDKAEPATTSMAPATETQTNQEIQTFLDQNDPGCTIIDSTCYDYHRDAYVMHYILAQIRLPKKFGGTGEAITIEIVNDTGSTHQSVFKTDLEKMNYDRNTYRGHTGNIQLYTANGIISRESLWVELRLLKPDKTPFGDWFLEQAKLDPANPPGDRFTGTRIRNEFLFATVPGRYHLYVAKVAQPHIIIKKISPIRTD